MKIFECNKKTLLVEGLLIIICLLAGLFIYKRLLNESENNRNIIFDKNKPVINSIDIVNVNENGYRVICDVSDDSEIWKVMFPTWTMNNGQDDMIPNWAYDDKAKGTFDGETYYYDVNISDHNFEKGEYYTHIYVYDKANNYAAQGITVNIE